MRIQLTAILAFALLPTGSSAHVVRHEFVPVSLQGSWAPSDGVCKKDDKSNIAISDRAYTSPELNCGVAYVSETSEAGGKAVFSAHLDCSKSTPPKQMDVILIPKTGELISLGSSFESLRDYKHCAQQ
jgi:hypothetical protein